MARVELRLINDHMLEELPPVCMFCGIGVKQLAIVRVTLGNRSRDLRLPLCKDDKVKWMADLQTRFAHSLANARVVPGAGAANLIVVGAVVAGHLMNASREQHVIPVDDVDPRFARALKQLRKQQLEEFERNLVAGAAANSKNDEPPNAFAHLGQEPAAETARPFEQVRRRAERRPSNLLPWIGGGIAVAMIVLLCLGAFVSGILRSRRGTPNPRGPAVFVPAGGGHPAPAPGRRSGRR